VVWLNKHQIFAQHSCLFREYSWFKSLYGQNEEAKHVSNHEIAPFLVRTKLFIKQI